MHFLPLTLLAAALASSSDSLSAPGVSHELARYRALHIRDVSYGLMLDVTRHDTAVGHARIDFTRVAGGDVYVDFRGHSFGAVRVNGHLTPAVEYNGAHMRFE